MNLDADDFTLFGLPRQFAQDRAAIDARWKALQREVHPDRFAAEGAAAQRLAMQWAVRVNEAHRRLLDPLRRAAYLCELRGVPVDAERNTAMPADFLAQQMAWHEALDEAETVEQVQALHDGLQQRRQAVLAEVEAALDARQDAAAAAELVRALMFIERFGQGVDARLQALGQ